MLAAIYTDRLLKDDGRTRWTMTDSAFYKAVENRIFREVRVLTGLHPTFMALAENLKPATLDEHKAYLGGIDARTVKKLGDIEEHALFPRTFRFAR